MFQINQSKSPICPSSFILNQLWYTATAMWCKCGIRQYNLMQPLVPRLLLQTRVTRTRSSQQDAESVLRNYPHSAHNLWNVTIWRSRALKGESPLRWQLCAAVGRCHRARCAMANTFWHVCLFDRILVRYPICCVPLNEADISYTSSYKCPTCVGISQYYCIKLTLCSLHLGIGWICCRTDS